MGEEEPNDKSARWKIGDTVRMRYPNRKWSTSKGRLATVEVVHDDIMNVRWIDERISYGFYHWRFEAASMPLKLDSAFSTRAGLPARYVGPSDDPDRPIRAIVQVGGVERELTYQANGLFYKNIQQDIDLVNTNG